MKPCFLCCLCGGYILTTPAKLTVMTLESMASGRRFHLVIKVLNYIVRHTYEEMTSEKLEDSMFAVVLFKVWRLVTVLKLFVVNKL